MCDNLIDITINIYYIIKYTSSLYQSSIYILKKLIKGI